MNEYEQNLFFQNRQEYSSSFEPFGVYDDPNYHFQFNFNIPPKSDPIEEPQKSGAEKPQTTKNTKFIPTCGIQGNFQGKKTVEIDYCPMVRLKAEKTILGTKDETVQLNTNFKTIIVNFFKELRFLNQLSEEQARLVQDFNFRSPSFKSFYQFCRSGPQQANIKEKLLGLLESKLIMARIMSSRCRIQTKLQMIKFVEILRRNVLSKEGIVKWKQLLRK